MTKKNTQPILQFFIVLSVIFAVGFAYFLGWNRYQNSQIMSLKQVKSVIIPVASSPIKPINNYKVVYVNGSVNTNEQIFDKTMNLNLPALSISRKVFIYQWEEEIHNNVLKKEIPSYVYKKTWSEQLIDSSNFEDQNNHKNPQQKPLNSIKIYAKQVSLGDFILSNSLVKKIKNSNRVILTQANKKALEQELKQKLVLVDDNTRLCSGTIEQPVIGDICVEVWASFPQTMSIIAQQINAKLRPYVSPAGFMLAIIDSGTHNPHQMIDNAMSEYDWQSPLTPIKRLVRTVTGF